VSRSGPADLDNYRRIVVDREAHDRLGHVVDGDVRRLRPAAPKTVIRPARQSNPTTGDSQSSWNISGRTITGRIDEASKRCSVAAFAAASGALIEATSTPPRDVNTNLSTPAASAAPTGLALPRSSTSRIERARSPGGSARSRAQL
jgi:hypothetical protein